MIGENSRRDLTTHSEPARRGQRLLVLRVKDSLTRPIVFALSEWDCVWYGATVTTTPESAAFDRGVRPVLRIVLPDKVEAVLSYRADPELQRRIDDLAAKSTEGQLTGDERAEYEGYVRANKFVAILLRQARQMAGTKP